MREEGVKPAINLTDPGPGLTFRSVEWQDSVSRHPNSRFRLDRPGSVSGEGWGRSRSGQNPEISPISGNGHYLRQLLRVYGKRPSRTTVPSNVI